MVARLNTSYTERGGYHTALAERFANIINRARKITAVNRMDSYQTSDNTAAESLRGLLYPKLERGTLSQDDQAQKAIEDVKDYDWAIEVAMKPGVRDNEGITASSLLDKLAARNIPVSSSKIFLIKGKIKKEDVEKIAATLYNPQIQNVRIIPAKELKTKGLGFNIPTISLGQAQAGTHTNEVNILDVTNDELILIGSQGVPETPNRQGTHAARRGPLSLDLAQMTAIKEHFQGLRRNPTDIELESIAQTWSEHCKHTIFASPIEIDGHVIEDGLYKHYIKKATQEINKPELKVSVFKDNAGAIEFDDQFLICDKAETHNSPSALDPYGGSITGILGVNRDILGFGLGAKPVANAYGFCVGRPDDNEQLYKDKELKTPMLGPKRILEGVVEGVKDGGNQSGIPTNLGFTLFDDSYKGKPLVFVRTIGLIPKKLPNGQESHKKQAKAGDNIVVIGGKVGKDGIHGATFSSEAMSQNSPTSAVQIGDSYTQKKLGEALLEARDKGLFNSVTDNGAGGLSCSVAEMAKEAGEGENYGGFDVKLDKVPLKYPGLKPWEIWISESQERMTLSVPDDKLDDFNQIMKDHDVESTVIGRFNNSGQCKVTYNNDKVMDMDMKFLHDGVPLTTLKTEEATTNSTSSLEASEPVDLDVERALITMLGRFNIASNEFISKQYDHEVQGGSVIKPLQGYGRVNADVGVFKPVLDSKKAVIMAHGINPSYSRSDSYNMAACAIDTAVRNAVAAGADPDKIALMDNFCWYKGKDPQSLWKLTRAAQACYDIATTYGTPFISGKDSMFNDFKGFDSKGSQRNISIDPSLLISSISVMDDANNAVGIDAKIGGDLVYALGETRNELADSEYMAQEKDTFVDGNKLAVPQVTKKDAKKNLELYRKIHQAMKQGLVASSIAISRGGLGVALAKTAMAGRKGLDIDLSRLNIEPGFNDNNTVALFSESQGRILVTVPARKREAFEKIINTNGISYQPLGTVTEDPQIEIRGLQGTRTAVNIKVDDALTVYKRTFASY